MNFKCLPEPDFSQVAVGHEPQAFGGGISPVGEVMHLLAFAYLVSGRSRVLVPAHRSNFQF